MAASKETANSRRDNLCDENASNEQVCKAPFRSLFEKSRVVNSLVNLKGVAKLFAFRDFQFLFSINLTGLAILLEGFFFVFSNRAFITNRFT